LPFAFLAVGFADDTVGPAQPIPYSHKVHIAAGAQCKDCHKNPDPGDFMGIPQAALCMNCHRSIKSDSPAVQKIAEFAKEKKEIPWVRVYRLPDYVFFNHHVHVEKGATCNECHGDVAKMDVMFKAADISMGACMNCHRAKKASVGCTYCHDKRSQ
jgi:hypothetical protein